MQAEDPQAPPPQVILVSDDLLARARVDDAATRAGVDLVVVPPGRASELVQQGAALVLVDLDAVDPWDLGAVDLPVIGYYSHIEPAKAEAARRAGWQAVARGRFWRELLELLLSLRQTP